TPPSSSTATTRTTRCSRAASRTSRTGKERQMRTIAVITAGLPTPSSTRQLADMLSDATVAAITARGESAEVKVIEVRDLARDLADAFTVGGLSSQRLDEARRTVASADAVIAVTPVFKASYSGLFKMFVDSLDDDALRS